MLDVKQVRLYSTNKMFTYHIQAKNLAIGSFYENEEEEDDTQNKGNSQMAVDDIPFPSLPSLSSYSESNSQSKPVRGRSSLTNKPSNKGEMDSMAIAVLSAAANRKNSSSSATAATSAKNVSNATNSSRPSHSNASSGVNKTGIVCIIFFATEISSFLKIEVIIMLCFGRSTYQ